MARGIIRTSPSGPPFVGANEDDILEWDGQQWIIAPGGGFVFATAHNIGPEVHPENVLAMYEAFEEHRDYPAC